jgi:hypothetical protein
MSRGIASLGRGPDTQLVHMSNAELNGLKHLAKAAGGHLTVNPHTGLYEAGQLDAILPLIAGAALSMTGIGAPAAAMMVGAEEGVRKKDWKAGLAAGLGAYGGAGLASGIGSAGAGAEASATTSVPTTTLTETAPATSTLAGDTSTLANGAYTDTIPASLQSDASTALPSSGITGQYTQTIPSELQGGTSASNAAARQSAMQEAVKAKTWNPDFKTAWSNMGKGATMQGITDAGSNMGRLGLMGLAAPYIYQASQPKPTPAPQPERVKTLKYDQATQSYYDPQYETYTPQNISGYATGGFVPAGGGSSTPAPISQPPSQDAIRAYYQSLMAPPTSPGSQPLQPPPPDANNQYMQNLNANLVANPHIGGHPVGGSGQPPPGQTGIPGGSGTPTIPTTPTTPTTPTPAQPPRMVGMGLFGRERGFADGGATTDSTDPTDPNVKAWLAALAASKQSQQPDQAFYGDPAGMLGRNLNQMIASKTGWDNTTNSGTQQFANGVKSSAPSTPNPDTPKTDKYMMVSGMAPAVDINKYLDEISTKTIPGSPAINHWLGKNLGGLAQGGIASLPPRHVQGPGDGMSDSIPARINGKQEAALGNDEFVIPADVVSHLGNGSSDAGAKRLYALMDQIRRDRTGTTKQAPQVNADKYLSKLA